MSKPARCTATGCNYPEGQCAESCAKTAQSRSYPPAPDQPLDLDVGEPLTPAETRLLYAIACIAFLVVALTLSVLYGSITGHPPGF